MTNGIRKVVIFAGGQGSRLAEYTETLPKPLVPVAGEPIVLHLMRSFYRQGYREFILALGYKSDMFKHFFRDYNLHGKSVSFSPFGMKVHENQESEDWTVHLVETGEDSLTGRRLHLLKDWIGDEPFFLTYGDGLSDVPLAKLEKQHFASGKLATITAVPVKERWGILDVDGAGGVNSFAEKSNSSTSFINGGFIACNPEILDSVSENSGDFSFDTLTQLADAKQLGYFEHQGFWKAADTKKDLDELNEIHNQHPEYFGKPTCSDPKK